MNDGRLDDPHGYNTNIIKHANGTCSYSGRPCPFANRCTLGREEACFKLFGSYEKNAKRNCERCRKRHGDVCFFECFREKMGKG